MYIEKIKNADDIKKLSIKELEILATEVRNIILVKCSQYGGHLGSNLGMYS